MKAEMEMAMKIMEKTVFDKQGQTKFLFDRMSSN